MFEPNSLLLVVLLAVLAGLGLWALIRYHRWYVRGVCGLLVVLVSATGGMAVVNDYYGYYRTWGQLNADLSGSYSSYALTAAHSNGSSSSVAQGALRAVTFPGATSHINRPGLVYLPPQYFQQRYATTRFPVVELLHGSPGEVVNWVIQLQVVRLMDKLIADHELGPMILVMPTMNDGHDYQDGVDAPGALDDTYLTRDVRADVVARFRASADPAQWGISGYSSGGYGAVNLALRHRAQFGAAGIMDGYFRPQDGPAAAALHHDPAAEAANDPMKIAAALSRDVSPLPHFWISAGTGDREDIDSAVAFARALHGVEAVPLFKEPGAGHDFYAWAAAMPHMLTWMWSQLGTPDLRVDFPVAGEVRAGILFSPRPLIRRVQVPAPSRSSVRSATPTEGTAK